MKFEIVMVMKMNSNILPSSSSILTPDAADITEIFVVIPSDLQKPEYFLWLFCL